MLDFIIEPKHIELFFERIDDPSLVGPLGLILGEICEALSDEEKPKKLGFFEKFNTEKTWDKPDRGDFIKIA